MTDRMKRNNFKFQSNTKFPIRQGWNSFFHKEKGNQLENITAIPHGKQKGRRKLYCIINSTQTSEHSNLI